MPKVHAQVTVRDPQGRLVSFAPGDNAPAWINGVVTNPAVIGQKPATPKPAPKPEPETEATDK